MTDAQEPTAPDAPPRHDAQEPTAPDAPPRRSTRWLGATGAVFALAIVLGGTDLLTGASSGWRDVVLVALIMAFLSFASLGAGIVPLSFNPLAIAGIGVVTLGIALVVSWSAPAVPRDRLPGLVQVKASHELICGDITSMDHDFVAITQWVREEPTSGRALGSDGRPKVTYVQRLVPVASIESIAHVDSC
ncbi:hypothetical protein [Dactylosporangium sp. NPDC048998]|uniref:hypothetical protein n=1 Tax=Dactylosporangium sp. NPDC048998 TaxID=3363976 RepID=UPI003713D7D5